MPPPTPEEIRRLLAEKKANEARMAEIAATPAPAEEQAPPPGNPDNFLERGASAIGARELYDAVTGNVDALATRAGDAITFGTQPYVEALGAMRGDDSYSDALERVRAQRAQQAEDYPVGAIGGDIIGTLTGRGKVAKALEGSGRAAQAAGQAAAGGIDALARSGGDTDEALKGAATEGVSAYFGGALVDRMRKLRDAQRLKRGIPPQSSPAYKPSMEGRTATAELGRQGKAALGKAVTGGLVAGTGEAAASALNLPPGIASLAVGGLSASKNLPELQKAGGALLGAAREAAPELAAAAGTKLGQAVQTGAPFAARLAYDQAGAPRQAAYNPKIAAHVKDKQQQMRTTNLRRAYVDGRLSEPLRQELAEAVEGDDPQALAARVEQLQMVPTLAGELDKYLKGRVSQ